MRKKKNAPVTGSPIFRKILIPMGVLILVEILLLAGAVFGGGVTVHMDQNARDILSERVINRRNYLENEMVHTWSNVDLAVQTINEKTAELAEQGVIAVDSLDDSSEACTPLILAISDDLISVMRSNRVTGAFVVFNNEDLRRSEETGEYHNKPGLYIRDLDPSSGASFRNRDLLLEHAPTAVVQQLDISTDSNWRPMYEFKNMDAYYPFLYEPYQQASENWTSDVSFSDYGFWSRPYALYEDNKQVISYSVPLVLEDGTVYGVMGIELTLDYLCKAIPYGELFEDKLGSYILAVEQDGSQDFDHVLVNGPVYRQATGQTAQTHLSAEAGDWKVNVGGEDFSCDIQYLNLYNTNTPFEAQRWVLIGAVRNYDLFAFSNRVTSTLITAILLTLLVGVFGSFLASRIIARPVRALAKEMDAVRPGSAVKLRRTGIAEIDRMTESIEKLSRDVQETAGKFTQIMKMASVKIAAFEYKWTDGTLFITDGFFEIIRLPGIDRANMTVEGFGAVFQELMTYCQKRETPEDDIIFKLPLENGFYYVKLTLSNDKERCIGVIEDVTKTVLARDAIERERDHDLLTGLINRRAFYRVMTRLFEEGPATLRTAALVMLDLDNLKQMNDTYGHDCGDKYICSAAECFTASTPEGTVVSRISGDEFYLFFYGYESKDQVREQIKRLQHGIRHKTFLLPNQQPSHIMASGGIAWYPDDSTSYEELLKFSDFAMYKVKQLHKGELNDFDFGIYSREAYLLQNRAELSQLLKEELLFYYFQPIVSARDGEVYGYEALMRANLPLLKTPDEILATAKREGKLNQIERMTWGKALAAYAGFVRAGKWKPGCRVFINSIASQTISDEYADKLEREYRGFLQNVVMEITEEEQLSEQSLQHKVRKMEAWNASIALDDYGSGYNSEKALLSLSPKFIKVDIAIITGIDSSLDKQKIVENIISYAHERGMLVVAEGIETAAEAATAIRMGVDYLQGYYFAKPDSEPPAVSREAVGLIQKLNWGN